MMYNEGATTLERLAPRHHIRRYGMLFHYSDFPRFWSKVGIGAPDECWLWTGSTASKGYGLFWHKGRSVRVHRLAYELMVGPIPEGLTLDHLCRVRHCVNPKHLEPVTGKINILRGEGAPAYNARKTHCLRGHPFNETNIYRPPARPKTRECFECKNSRNKITNPKRYSKHRG